MSLSAIRYPVSGQTSGLKSTSFLGARAYLDVDDCLHHRVVEQWAHFVEFSVFTGGVHPVGEEDGEKLALGIDPDRSAGEAGMPERVIREILSR